MGKQHWILGVLLLFLSAGCKEVTSTRRNSTALLETAPIIPGACGSTPNGGYATRTRFKDESVSEGQVCQSQEQRALCTDANLGIFSGTYTFEVCVVNPLNAGADVPLQARGTNYVYSNYAVDGGKEIVFGSLTINQRLGGQFIGGYSVNALDTEKSNYLVYNTSIDGYEGRGYGICLKKGDCPAMENQDLFQIATAYDKVIRNLLIKNVEIKNEFVVEPGQHGDLLQTGTWRPDPNTYDVGDWLVLQDSVLKNSDHGTMNWAGDNFKGIVLQNLMVYPGWLDANFERDRQARINSFAAPPNYGNQSIGAGSVGKYRSAPQVAWFINSRVADPNINSVNVSSQDPTDPNQLGPVILVGPLSKNLSVFYEYLSGYDSNGRAIWERPLAPSSKVFRYDYIEDALQNHARPPFLELSCSGWRNPPANCSNSSGPSL